MGNALQKEESDKYLNEYLRGEQLNRSKSLNLLNDHCGTVGDTQRFSHSSSSSSSPTFDEDTIHQSEDALSSAESATTTTAEYDSAVETDRVFSNSFIGRLYQTTDDPDSANADYLNTEKISEELDQKVNTYNASENNSNYAYCSNNFSARVTDNVVDEIRRDEQDNNSIDVLNFNELDSLEWDGCDEARSEDRRSSSSSGIDRVSGAYARQNNVIGAFRSEGPATEFANVICSALDSISELFQSKYAFETSKSDDVPAGVIESRGKCPARQEGSIDAFDDLPPNRQTGFVLYDANVLIGLLRQSSFPALFSSEFCVRSSSRENEPSVIVADSSMYTALSLFLNHSFVQRYLINSITLNSISIGNGSKLLYLVCERNNRYLEGLLTALVDEQRSLLQQAQVQRPASNCVSNITDNVTETSSLNFQSEPAISFASRKNNLGDVVGTRLDDTVDVDDSSNPSVAVSSDSDKIYLGANSIDTARVPSNAMENVTKNFEKLTVDLQSHDRTTVPEINSSGDSVNSSEPNSASNRTHNIVDKQQQQQIKTDIKEMSSSQNVSEAGPVTAAEFENVHSTSIFEEQSDLEYFSQFGGTGIVAENLRKQSLYAKFDPLVAAAADSSTNLKDNVSPVSGNQNRSAENGLPGKGTSTPFNSSPAQSKLSPSPKVVSTARYVDIDQDEISKLHSLLLRQMKKEESFQEEISRIKNENEEMSRKLNNAENEVARLNSALQAALDNEMKLKKELQEKIKGKQQLSLVMEEYEKTISQMVTRREEEKKDHEAQLKKMEMERDNTVQHLNNLEIAFNDIHQKYERGKVVNESLKKNEDGLKKSLADYEKLVKVVENKYEMLKSHAASQLEKANQELELITQSYENEQAKLKALLRKSDVQINSLQDALDRKAKENQELTAICDELIIKLSSHSNGQT